MSLIQDHTDKNVAAAGRHAPRLGLAWNFPIVDHERRALRRVYDEIVDVIAYAEEHGAPETAGYSVRDFLDNIAFYGAPADVAAQFAVDPTDPAATATDFVANFNNGAAFDADVLRAQLRVLTEEIGPLIGWPPAAATRHDTKENPHDA